MAESYSTLMGAKKAAETAALQRKKLMEQAQYDQWRGAQQVTPRQLQQQTASIGVGQTPGSTFRKVGSDGQLYWGQNTGQAPGYWNGGQGISGQAAGQSMYDEYQRRLQSALAEQQGRYLSQQNQLHGSYNDWAQQYANTMQSQYGAQYAEQAQKAMASQRAAMEAEYRRQAALAQAEWEQKQKALMKGMTPDQIDAYAKATGQRAVVSPGTGPDGKPTTQIGVIPGQGATDVDMALYEDWKRQQTAPPGAYTAPGETPAANDPYWNAKTREPQYKGPDIPPDDIQTIVMENPAPGTPGAGDPGGGAADLPPTEGKATPTTAPTAPKTFNWEEWLKMFGSGELG